MSELRFLGTLIGTTNHEATRQESAVLMHSISTWSLVLSRTVPRPHRRHAFLSNEPGGSPLGVYMP